MDEEYAKIITISSLVISIVELVEYALTGFRPVPAANFLIPFTISVNFTMFIGLGPILSSKPPGKLTIIVLVAASATLLLAGVALATVYSIVLTATVHYSNTTAASSSYVVLNLKNNQWNITR